MRPTPCGVFSRGRSATPEWNLLRAKHGCSLGGDMNETRTHGTSATETLERMRDAIADTMHATARTLHEKLPDRSEGETSRPPWGLRTAERLDRLSEELRRWDVRDSESRLRASIGNHPGSALLL